MAGQPTKYCKELADKMLVLYKAGWTDSQVAEYFKISTRSIDRWKLKYPEFCLALLGTKASVDWLVKHSIFHKAVGYSHAEEKHFVWEGQVITVNTTKHFPPDVPAANLWLRNRDPNWKAGMPTDNLFHEAKTIPAKKTYEQFCIDAGYPKPYPKQCEMREFGIDGPKEPKLLLGYRGCGKTDYVTNMGTAYDIYLNGTTNLIISKSKVRNRAMIGEIANALIKNGVELEMENSECIRIKGHTGKDHSAEVLTIKSSFRGRHPDRILMDDVVTEEDTSDATRILVKKKYDEAYKLCKNITIIGQPAHKFDLHQELRPALIKMEVPHGTIPELAVDLDAMRLAGVDEHSIQMSYFLNVLSEGTTPFDKVRYLDEYIPGETVAFIDPSFEGGDYTACSIVRAYMDGVAVVGFTFKKAWNHCLDQLAPKLSQFNVKRICFETNSLGEMPVELLRKTFPSIGITGRKSNGNKHSRIMAAGAYAHLIHLSKLSDKIYLDQVVKYEYKAKFDDAPDSLASCLEWIGLIRGKT